MKRLARYSLFLALPCLASLSTPTARAEVFLMDFNTTDSGTYPGGSSAWNIYAAPSNVNGSAIADTTGSIAAGITLSRAGTINDSGNGGTVVFNNATGGPSWVTTDGSLANTGAAGDYFYTSTGGGHESYTMTLGGLTPGTIASLDLWMSRVTATAEGLYEYSLDGGTNWFGFTVLEKDGTPSTSRNWDTNDTQSQGFLAVVDGNNAARYMNASGLTLTGSTLAFRVTDTEVGGSWSGIGAVRLTLTAVPEPSTVVALAGMGLAGALGYVLRRRRR